MLAVALFWPLAAHLGRDIPLDLGDPLSQSWQVAWDGHALAHQPLHLFQSNQFWPLPDSLAFSDALIGYAPAGLLGHGVHAAVARYDVLWLLAFALAFLGTYLLARELGAPPWAAAVGAAAFAFSPWRLEQGGHLHVLSSGGIPLALMLLLRGLRRDRARLLLGGFAVAAWQVSLGFSLGLPLLYLLVALGLVAAILWLRAGRPAPPRRMLAAAAAGVVLLAGVSLALARPYVRVLHDHPEAKRSSVTVSRYSGPPRMFLTAPETSLIWGAATKPIRDGLHAIPEQTLFPGLIIVLLALAGLGWTGWPRALRIGLGLAVLALAVLSLGFQQHGVGAWLPYRALYEVVPGWRGIRVPGRLHTLTTLALALLAAAGAARVLSAAVRRPRLGAAAGALLVACVLAEGAGVRAGHHGQALAAYPHPRVPAQPARLTGLRAPLLQLPTAPDDNRRYLIWSTDGFAPMVNGRSSFEPRFFGAVIMHTRCFPDAASIAYLHRVGVRTVVVHTELAPPPRPPDCGPPSDARQVRRGPLLITRIGR